MEDQSYIRIQSEFPDTHYFLYKNQKYPIKINYFELSSKYFQRNREEFQNSQAINLIDEENEYNNDDNNFNLTAKTINEFIQYVQHQQIPLNKENVIGLNYLSERFEIDELKENTKRYIDNHQEDLIFDLLQNSKIQKMKQNNIYEDIISKNLSRFIDDDRLLDLKIPILFRILKNKKIESNHQKLKQKINEFIFKCLRKHGRPASILFTFLENDEISIENISMILNEFYGLIDFEFINKNLIKKIYDEFNQTKSELESKLEKQMKINKDNLKLIEKLRIEKVEEIEKNKNESLLKLKEISNLKEQMSIEVSKLMDEKKKIESDYLGKLKEKDLKIEELLIEIKNLKSDQENLKLKQKEENNKQIEKEKQIFEKKILEMKNKKEEKIIPKENIHSFEYINGQEFNGIIKYLTNLKGDNIHDNGTIEVTSNSIGFGGHHPKNLLKQDSYKYAAKLREHYFWICFDFKSMQIKVSNYTIKSSNCSIGAGHIKSWIIEVSNDSENWEKIDEHSNSNELNGPNIIKTFQTKPSEFSRYIRFHHNGEYWGSNDGFYLCLDSIEFYGQLIIPNI